jgi:methionine-rich copper-binding protein CopC
VRLRRTAPGRAAAAGTALAVGALLVALGATPAAAHASLVHASPADGSSVATAPKTVSLTFDENIRMPSVILVYDAEGASVVRGKTSVADNIVSTRVGATATGDYTVVYRAVSADGHPVAGRLVYRVGTGSPGGGISGHAIANTSAHHQNDSTSSGSNSRVVAMIAGLALLGGLGLLTVRRWAPGLWGNS